MPPSQDRLHRYYNSTIRYMAAYRRIANIAKVFIIIQRALSDIDDDAAK